MLRNFLTKSIVSILLLLSLSGCFKDCLESHTERKWRPAWTQYILVGKVMVPIYHSGYFYNATVCDKYEE